MRRRERERHKRKEERKRKGRVDDLVRKSRESEFNCKSVRGGLGNQDKTWALHTCCISCITT